VLPRKGLQRGCRLLVQGIAVNQVVGLVPARRGRGDGSGHELGGGSESGQGAPPMRLGRRPILLLQPGDVIAIRPGGWQPRGPAPERSLVQRKYLTEQHGL